MRHLVHSLELQVVLPVVTFSDITVSPFQLLSVQNILFFAHLLICTQTKSTSFWKTFSPWLFFLSGFSLLVEEAFSRNWCAASLCELHFLRTNLWSYAGNHWTTSWMLNLNFFRKVKAALIFAMLFMRSWAAPWMSSSEAIPVGHIRRA